MTTNTPLYSLSQLEELSSGDEVFITKMVDMFIDMVPKSIDSMVDALANEAYEDLGKAAHKLKPTIDMMGIVSLKQTIRTLEKDGKESLNIDNIPVLLEEVVSTLNKVIEQLKNR